MDRKHWAGLVLLGALMGCASPQGADTVPQRLNSPGVDDPSYERDRAECEAQVLRAPSNYPLTDRVRFRQCLIDKGYRLLG